MSLPPHREKDAKVEGRDPLETAPKQTMAPFRRLMGRLLQVKPEEVAEQQRMYEASQEGAKLQKRKKLRDLMPPTLGVKTKSKEKRQVPNADK